MVNWKILEIYTASDHQCIAYSLETNRITDTNKAISSTRKWNIKKINKFVLKTEIDRLMGTTQPEGDAREIVSCTMDILIRRCNKSMPKLKPIGGNKSEVH